MKALSVNEEKELEIISIDKPTPGKGEVLIAVKAAALNHRDIWITKGLYPGMSLPSTIGTDGAGIVSEIGKGVEEKWLGKEVICYPALGWGDNPRAPSKEYRLFGMPGPGFIADFITVPEENLVEKPNHLSWDEAAAFPVAALTAWRSLQRHGRIQDGDRVLVTGIGGGVAQIALLLAKEYDVEIFVTSGDQAKIDFAKSLGAKDGVNYKDADWCKKLKEISGGIDIIIDSSPPEKISDYLWFLNMGSRVVIYGATANPITSLTLSRFFLRHASIIGTAMGTLEEFVEVIDFIDKHEIKPTISKSFKFDDCIEAFHFLKSGKQLGKITINNFNN